MEKEEGIKYIVLSIWYREGKKGEIYSPIRANRRIDFGVEDKVVQSYWTATDDLTR